MQVIDLPDRLDRASRITGEDPLKSGEVGQVDMAVIIEIEHLTSVGRGAFRSRDAIEKAGVVIQGHVIVAVTIAR